MSDTITDLPTASTIDPANDWLPIDTASVSTTQKINRNTLLNLSSQPVGINDTQTLTNKVLTAPTLSSPVLSGTVTGTYTLGGTPTFPSSVVTLTGSQTLTNKVLTSPTINSPTISNATLSADAITGYSVSNTGTIYGISVTTGSISSALSLGSTLSVTGATTLSSLTASGIIKASGGNPVWQYLGYAQITSDATSTTSTTFQDVTGLSVTVNVPSGVTKVKFTFCGLYQSSASGGAAVIALNLDGSIVQQMFQNSSGNNYNYNGSFMYLSTPTPGSHTYKLQFAGDGTNTTKVRAGSAGSAEFTPGPAFILVECC